MIDPTDRALVKLLNQATKKSKYYKQLTQNKYRHLKGYVEYDDVMFEIARIRYSYDSYPIDFFQTDFVHKNCLLTIADFLANDFKPLWLSPNLFQAFQHTDIPSQLQSFHRVVKNGILFLPYGLKTPDGADIRWVIFSHNLATDIFPDVNIRNNILTTYKNNYDSLTFSCYDSDRYQYSSNRALYLIDGKLNTEQGKDNFIIRTDERTDENVEKKFMETLFNLIINTLIYLQTYEEKIITEPTKINKNKAPNKNKLEPYIVGENYKTKTLVEKINNKIGAKKTQHWRRGHYRNQICGKRNNPDHKLVWIEPVLINAI
jgi:hypothetical protein